MAAPIKDIKKLAQLWLQSKGFYSGDIDGKWGKGSNAGYDAYMAFLADRGLEIGEEEAVCRRSVGGGRHRRRRARSRPWRHQEDRRFLT